MLRSKQANFNQIPLIIAVIGIIINISREKQVATR